MYFFRARMVYLGANEGVHETVLEPPQTDTVWLVLELQFLK